MITNYKEKCEVKLVKIEANGFLWKVSTLPHPKYGSKRVFCTTIQMLEIVAKLTLNELSRDFARKLFADLEPEILVSIRKECV